MTKGVWVNSEVIEAKLTVHPISTFERPTYVQYLSKHFSPLEDGFFFRAARHDSQTCSCCDFQSSPGEGLTYEITSPRGNLLYTGIFADDGKSIDSSVDSDSEAEVHEGTTILLMDSRHKSLIRITYSSGNFYKNQVTRVESPPGVLLGWIERHKRFMTSGVYHLYEGTEPVVPNMILKKCSNEEGYDMADEDGEAHDSGCFPCLFPCGRNGLKMRMFEIMELLQVEKSAKEKGVGMIFGSCQAESLTVKTGADEKITCSFNPSISCRRKVLILSAVIIIHFNHEIA